VVRVRRTPQSSNKKSVSLTLPKLDTSHPSNEKTVVFTPGPVGLQLEPVNADPVYGCRVVRFVDGGPKNPGQARRSGMIKPGDWVLKVKAEGTLMAATTFEEILDLLKHTHVKRILTVKSMWDESIVEGKGEIEHESVNTKAPPATLGFIPTRKTTLSKPSAQSSRFTPAKLLATHAPPQIPPSVPEDEVLLSPPRSYSINNELVKSPSDMVLLSKSLDDLSRISSSNSSQKSTTDGPVIISITSLSLYEEHENDKASMDEVDVSDGEDSITRSRSPSVFSEQTAKSCNKSHMIEDASQALADQFLLLDGFPGAFVPESPYASSRTQSRETTTASGYEDVTSVDEEDEEPATPVQELSYSPQDNRISDSAKSQLQHQQELLDRSLLRADFEQRLQAARLEYSKTERELKELYVQTCERNEIKIRELQSIKISLRKKVTSLEEANQKLEEESSSRSMELEMSKTMINELESRMMALESEKNETVIRFNQACDSIQELEESNEQKDQTIAAKNSEIEKLQSQICSLNAELTKEKEGHQTFAKKALNLEMDLEGKEEQAERLEKQVEIFQSRLHDSNVENQELKRKLDFFEQEKAEAVALAEQLSRSVEEKQKALVTGRSIVLHLENENESLTKQIEATNVDVENLLQDKLSLEQKFADLWKDYQQAKKDASAIHETMMEKLENGEFFTATDIEQKQALVEAMKIELDDIRTSSFESDMRLKKNALNLHLKLHGVESILQDVQRDRDETCLERDKYSHAMQQLRNSMMLAYDQLRRAKCDFEKIQHDNETLQSHLLAKIEDEQEVEYNCVQLKDQLSNTTIELTASQRKLDEVMLQCENLSANKAKLLRRIDDLEASKASMERDYKQKTKDLATMKGKVVSAERALSIFAQKLSESKSIEDTMFKKYQAIEREKADAEISFHSKVQALEEQLDSLREWTKVREMDVETVKVSNERDVTDLKKTLEGLSDELEAKDGELSRAQTTIQLLKEEIVAGQSKLAMVENKLKEMQQNMEKSEKSYSEEIHRLQDSLEIRDERLRTAKTNFENLQQEMGVVKQNLKEKVEFLNSSSDQAKEQRVEIEQLREKLDAHIEAFELKKKAWGAREFDLATRIEAMKLEIERAGKVYSQDVNDLTSALSAAQAETDNANAKLKEQEVCHEESLRQLHEKLDCVTNEAEESATTYWEDLQGLTAELQLKEELLSCAESRMQHLEQENEQLCQTTEGYERKLAVSNAQLADLKEELSATAKLLGGSEARCSQLDSANIDLQSKIAKFEEAEVSETRIVSEDIALVKEENREMKSKLDTAMQSIQELREREVQALRNKELLVLELEEKTKQLETQTITVSRLHEEICSMMKEMKSEIETLQLSLHSEKESKERAMTEAADAKMELSLQVKKFFNQNAERDKALCKSENIRSKLASLLQANAEIASLKVQMEETKKINVLHSQCEHKIESIEKALMETEAEKRQNNERILFLQETLQEKDNACLVHTRTLENLHSELSGLRDQLLQKDVGISTLETSLKNTEKEVLHLRNVAAETGLLHEELEAKSNQIIELEMTISKAEHFAESACNSLALAQNSEDGLREKFAGLRKCLRKEVMRLKDVYGSPMKADGDDANPPTLRSPYRDEKSTLEYELSSISLEMESLSAMIDKRSTDFDALHQTVDELFSKLAENEHSSSAFKQQKEALQVSVSSYESQLHVIEKDYQDQVLTLQKMVLATRASCIAIQSRKRRLQKMVLVEKTDLLKNIESLSAQLVSMQDLQETTDEQHEHTLLSLRKCNLKLLADHIVLHLESQNLKKDFGAMECHCNCLKATAAEANTRVSLLENEASCMKEEIQKFVAAGKTCADLVRHIEDVTSRLELSAKKIAEKDLKILGITSAFKSLEALKNELDDENKTLRSALAETKSSHRKMEEEVTLLSEEVESQRERNGSLTVELAATNAANAALRDAAKSLRASVSEAKSHLSQSDQRVAFLESELHSETQKRQKLEQDLTVTTTSLDNLHWKLEQFCAKAERDESEKHTHEEHRTSLQMDIAEMRQTLDGLQREQKSFRETVSNERSELLSSLQQHQSHVTALRSEIEIKDQTIVGLRDSAGSLDEEQKGIIIALAKFSEALESERAKTAMLDALKNDLKSQLQELKFAHVNLQKELEESRRDRADLKDTKAHLEADFLERIKRLDGELADSRDKLYTSETKLLSMMEEVEHARKTIQSLESETEILGSYRSSCKKNEQELERRALQARQQETRIVDLEESLENLQRECFKADNEIEEKTAEIAALVEEVKDRDCEITKLQEQIAALTKTTEGLTQELEELSKIHDRGLSEDMANHVYAVKDAFRKQTEVLDDLKLSENVLSNFMNEVMRLASKAESEALELSSTLNSVEDLLIRPSSCLASLDLAGIGAANEYIEEVRTRLEDMAALAYDTSVELKVRQSEFHQWKSSRQAPPSIPITPPPKPLKRILFSNDASTRGTSVDIQSNKIAGARLMSCVMENRSKMELASAFRKWSCCAGAMSASCSHKETAVALAQQLDQTREKLQILKSHLKGKQQKPRLRRILDRLDSNSNRDQHHVNDDVSFEI
jgi:nucleoprotein TPR